MWSVPVTLIPQILKLLREVHTTTNTRIRKGQLWGRDRKSPPSTPGEVATASRQNMDSNCKIQSLCINLSPYIAEKIICSQVDLAADLQLSIKKIMDRRIEISICPNFFFIESCKSALK
jgi:hypothetical protein